MHPKVISYRFYYNTFPGVLNDFSTLSILFQLLIINIGFGIVSILGLIFPVLHLHVILLNNFLL